MVAGLGWAKLHYMCGEAVALVDYLTCRDESSLGQQGPQRPSRFTSAGTRVGSLCLGVHGAWAAWHGMAWHGSQTVMILVCYKGNR